MPNQLASPQRFPASAYPTLDASSSISIPLHVVPLVKEPAPTSGGTAAAAGGKKQQGGNDDGNSGFKVGIMLSISTAGGSAPAGMYEFDTGGQGFWIWPTGTLPQPQETTYPLNITYTSGLQYGAVPVQATITFTEAPSLSTTAMVAMIGSVQGPQAFPIYEDFWGDFGCALQAFNGGVETTTPSLLTVLAQLPAPYNNGFIVDVGPYPVAGVPSVSQLIVGLTPELRALFPNTLKLTPSPTPYPSGNTSIATFLENVIQGNLTIQGPGATPAATPVNGSAADIGVVFDTGAPSVMVHSGSEVTFGPNPGDQLNLTPNAASYNTPAPDYAVLSFEVGTAASYNAASLSTKNVLKLGAGYINTGLNAFFQYQVMFDLANGLIGFPQAGLPPTSGQG